MASQDYPLIGSQVSINYPEKGKVYEGRVDTIKPGRESVLVVVETPQGFRSFPVNKVTITTIS